MPKTLLMGILNVTPDSFYEESRAYALDEAITRGLQLHQQGADLLDIGGESTRPGADPVPLEEELRRVIPVIASLSKRLPSRSRSTQESHAWLRLPWRLARPSSMISQD